MNKKLDSVVTKTLGVLLFGAVSTAVYQNRPLDPSVRYATGPVVEAEIMPGTYDAKSFFGQYCISLGTEEGKAYVRKMAQAYPYNFTYSRGANKDFAVPTLHPGTIKIIDRCNK